ncbi:hypothetical protein [Rubinisphaera brasiliensis]|uniref:Uncharacterized protein n=1 Tax=Rubinisphaera brasiliensis (strain ATCC 49424 / DSM 5305 / JCM 21570 / IAM 15109 / NBRC 103401 / IFAM 1448) TaxID=756272 RepID=F0SSU3_RUBBR|nr:hypothetical protein [Rubinisphaera brasiliensis]ADY61421.1 hypothetical protein Plabr_3837 [Rubinisphaera brasiliensis DSM 5305]
MSRRRLEFALEELKPEQWRIFEEFASSFLAVQFPQLRTTATTNDKGRDGECFSSEGKPTEFFQFSVSVDWKTKIRKTQKRLATTFPSARILRYVTNQSIRADGDAIKEEMLSKGIVLDILDKGWFVDRIDTDESRQVAAEYLAEHTVDPLLQQNGILPKTPIPLTENETLAALTFLQLQWEDDNRDKGLTRICFEALVRTALRGTSEQHHASKEDIYTRISAILPHNNETRVRSLIDSTLSRLNKRTLKGRPSDDRYWLSRDDSQRLTSRLAEAEYSSRALDNEIQHALKRVLEATDEHRTDLNHLTSLCRLSLDRYLMTRGERFAIAVANDQLERIGSDGLTESIRMVVHDPSNNVAYTDHKAIENIFLSSIQDLLSDPSDSVQKYLRSRADAYTLMAFLEHTPDVQRAVKKMFSHGKIWLDTSILLPLLAESLLPTDMQRFSHMLDASSAAGLSLRVTQGVITETERHINMCNTYMCRSPGRWQGRVPYLAQAFLFSGRGALDFPSWIETFVGTERPEDDIADYIADRWSIQVESLKEDERRANEEVKEKIFKVWYDNHQKRREAKQFQPDESITRQAAEHDVECYLGVVEKRRLDNRSPLGHAYWWLTLDGTAFRFAEDIRSVLKTETPSSPIMSADFLVNYLSVGPIRSRVSKLQEQALPIALDIGLEEIPVDLLAEAEKIRLEASDLPERLIQRRVRDGLDRLKRQQGRPSAVGMDSVLKDIKKSHQR